MHMCWHTYMSNVIYYVWFDFLWVYIHTRSNSLKIWHTCTFICPWSHLCLPFLLFLPSISSPPFARNLPLSFVPIITNYHSPEYAPFLCMNYLHSIFRSVIHFCFSCSLLPLSFHSFFIVSVSLFPFSLFLVFAIHFLCPFKTH